MNNNSSLTMDNKLTLGNIISWFFGLLFMAIGIINTFWGNDPGYGIFIILLSFVFFPPATTFLKKISGITIPVYLKIMLGIFIIWSAMGVAELPEKVDLMLQSFNNQ